METGPFESMDDLEAIKDSEDPMIRVIYNLGMRQFALHERQVELSNKLDKLIDVLERTKMNGSYPNLKAIR